MRFFGRIINQCKSKEMLMGFYSEKKYLVMGPK